MKFSQLLPILAFVFCWQGLSAQDIHYTLFDYAPLRSNPALTGAFNGSVRVGGIYRGQWFTVGSFASYSTPSFYADAPVIKGFRQQDWVGVGLTFLNDEYGMHNLRTSGGLLSGSYHLANKKRTNVFTLGAQYGRMNRRIMYGNLEYQQYIATGFGGEGLTTGGEFDGNGTEGDPTVDYTDINIGLLYRSKLDKDSDIEFGLSGLHLNSDRNNLLSGGGTANREMTVVGHAIYSRRLDEKWSMNPKLYFQTTEAGKSEIQLQAWAGRQVKPDFKVNFGLGYRVGDAANLLFGIEHKDIRAALAYDVTLSGARTITDYQGGFELAAYYIIKIYKNETLPPSILCPRF